MEQIEGNMQQLKAWVVLAIRIELLHWGCWLYLCTGFSTEIHLLYSACAPQSFSNKSLPLLTLMLNCGVSVGYAFGLFRFELGL